MRKLPCNIASWCATIVLLTPNLEEHEARDFQQIHRQTTNLFFTKIQSV